MTELLKPFIGLRPNASLAQSIVAPPYDIVTRDQARVLAQDKPHSFLHISRAEIDLPDETDPFSERVYETATRHFHAFLHDSILQSDDKSCYYIYRIIQGDHQQTGLVAAVSVAAYRNGLVRKHEVTRPEKEHDRIQLGIHLNAQISPVLLTMRHANTIQALVDRITVSAPLHSVIANDGTQHQLWCVSDDNDIQAITNCTAQWPMLYIADGHHRCAAAAKVAEHFQKTAHAKSNHDSLLAVIFPEEQLRIEGYHRLVKDLNGLSRDDFLHQLKKIFDIRPLRTPTLPQKPKQLTCYFKGQWYELVKIENHAMDNVIDELDVSLLHQHIIEPLLAIHDPRTDKRIHFIGGRDSLEQLQSAVDSGEWAVAFALHPTTMTQLLSVADHGLTMPPKSTWFEPKLLDGLIAFQY